MGRSSKPHFKRQESWRYKRLPDAWRRPRGGTSRVRKEKRGWPPKVDIGHGSSSATRGLHPSGLVEKLIQREADLEGLDPKVHIARLSSRLGEKKRLVLLDRVRQLNLNVANPGVEEARPITEEEAITKEPEKLTERKRSEEGLKEEEGSALEETSSASEENIP